MVTCFTTHIEHEHSLQQPKNVLLWFNVNIRRKKSFLVVVVVFCLNIAITQIPDSIKCDTYGIIYVWAAEYTHTSI